MSSRVGFILRRMATCPLCQREFETVRHREGIYYRCPGCGGRTVTVPQVRRTAGDRFATMLLRQINQAANPSARVCPFCSRPMKQFRISAPELTLDACRRCGAVWFDPAEFEHVPQCAVQPDQEIISRTREAIALKRIEHIARVEREANPCPEESWKWIPALLGMPVELEEPPRTCRPVATWSLAAAMVLVSVFSFFNLQSAVENFGFIPDQLWRYGGLTLLSSFFLHGGILHLVGNVYFLMLVGDNVEDQLGRKGFLAVVFLSALAGHGFHLLGDSRSAIPCVGASGGISGLMCFYALAFPKSRLGFLLRYFVVPLRWFQMPAWGAFALWVALQILGAVQQIAGFSHVSALAHLGGAAVGAGFWTWWRKRAAARGQHQQPPS